MSESVCKRGRFYHDSRESSAEHFPGCEHCDGAKSHLVRVDRLRGQVCPICDSALDEMLAEAQP